MPKLPIDYSKGLIYTIKCKDETITEEYIGSTTNFNKRKNCHKSDCNNEKSKGYNLKKYQFIRDNGSWNNWNMIMIEEYPCENKRQLEMREEEIRVERQAKLNMVKSFGAETIEEYQKEWYEENKGKYKEYHKIYHKENIEKIKENKKLHYEENKQQISDYKKKWYEENKKKILEKRKEYYENNKEKKLEYQKEYSKENKDKIK